MKTYDQASFNFYCKACKREWYGEKKRRIWEDHCETKTHKTLIDAILLGGKDIEFIHNEICYEEIDFGNGYICKLGKKDEK